MNEFKSSHYEAATVYEHFDRDINTLAEIAEILAARFGQQQILHDVLEILERRLGMIRATVMLLTQDDTEIVVEALKDKTHVRTGHATYKWGEGITGKVVETGNAAYVVRVSEEPLFRDRIHRRKERNQADVSFICVPVKVGDEVVGALSVDLPVCEYSILREHGRTLGIVASLIASDVKNRRIAHLENEELASENLRLRDALGEDFKPENMTGNSKAMHDVYMRLHHVMPTDTTVLIRGESGTGKELVASAIHYGSLRKNTKIIKVNCAVLNEHLLESELFGHEKGAFTSAVQTRIGRVEAANGGTLFLDEIGEISLSMQAKLLRVLQEREFERVGSNSTIKVDVRIIAATNRDLESMVSLGTFRKDLYYRINVFPVFIPSLCERKEDILPLANHFLDKNSNRLKKHIRRISTPAINMMMAYHWPGNVRELENCIEYAALLSTDGVIHAYHLPPTLQTPIASEMNTSGVMRTRVQNMERDMLIDALKQAEGNMTAAGRELGITSRMVRYKIKKFSIDLKRII